jgi:serine/threonine-protein kinase/endoribonuclease IRE1
VKRILTTYADVAMKEVQTLQAADYHENVVRYYCQQQRGSFLYIALELCPGSLYDVVTKPHMFEELVNYMDPRDTLYQITHGLHHLHTLKIVHRDIKPQNILVGAPNFRSTRPRLLISDFGLCKKLQSDEYSFGATTAQHAGTVGWRAPELLQDAVSLASGFPQPNENSGSGTGSASTDIVVDPLTKRRATRAIDIFALGCVCYFVLSRGHHPFGERFSRELNIVRGNSDLGQILVLKDAGHEAADLIGSMIRSDPKQRYSSHLFPSYA